MSKVLGDVLGARPGDRVTVEVLEGARPVREVTVARLVDDYMGLAAFMEIGALHRMMREGDSLSGAYLLVDSSRMDALYRRLEVTPAVAGIALTEKSLASFRALMAENFTIMTVFNVIFATIIACGVVYNAARISLSERSRELASLRVLGFTIGEISLVLLGELALLTLPRHPARPRRRLGARQAPAAGLPERGLPASAGRHAAERRLVGARRDRGRRALGPRGAPQAGPSRPRRRAQDPGVAP